MNLAALEPFKPAFTGSKLSIFDEVLRDSSILPKSEKQLILQNIVSELQSTIGESVMFDSENVLGLEANPLYNEENLGLAAKIAESVLSASRTSLCKMFSLCG